MDVMDTVTDEVDDKTATPAVGEHATASELLLACISAAVGAVLPVGGWRSGTFRARRV